jgi:hypothetical protein
MAGKQTVGALFVPRYRIRGVSFEDYEILSESWAVEKMPKGSQPLGIREGMTAGTWVIDFAVPVGENGKADPHEEEFTFAFLKPHGDEFEGNILGNLGHIVIPGDRQNPQKSRLRVLWVSNPE